MAELKISENPSYALIQSLLKDLDKEIRKHDFLGEDVGEQPWFRVEVKGEKITLTIVNQRDMQND